MPVPGQNGKNNQKFKFLRYLAKIILIFGMYITGTLGLIATVCGVFLGGAALKVFLPYTVAAFVVLTLISKALK